MKRGRSKYATQPLNENCYNYYRDNPLVGDQPRMVKFGETQLVEVGKIYEKIRPARTHFGTVGRLYLHVGAASRETCFSLQIEEWRINPYHLDEAIKKLRTGMMVVVTGHRLSVLKPEKSAFGASYYQLNIVDSVCILEQKPTIVDDFVREMTFYDRTIIQQE